MSVRTAFVIALVASLSSCKTMLGIDSPPRKIVEEKPSRRPAEPPFAPKRSAPAEDQNVSELRALYRKAAQRDLKELQRARSAWAGRMTPELRAAFDAYERELWKLKRRR